MLWGLHAYADITTWYCHPAQQRIMAVYTHYGYPCRHPWMHALSLFRTSQSCPGTHCQVLYSQWFFAWRVLGLLLCGSICSVSLHIAAFVTCMHALA